MKIIRSAGQSFTKINENSSRLAERGLRRPRNKISTPAAYRESLELQPEQLSKFLTEEYNIVIRQVVSILDKVISKPRNLGRCHIQTYLDRTYLSMALWKHLERQYRTTLMELDESGVAFEEFRKAWFWKVHPYAEKTCEWSSPSTDDNAALIKKLARNDVSRESANGRWHKAFWKSANDKPDYEAIAKSIWSHLFEQEVKIKDGGARARNDESPIKPGGLIEVRGQTISYSTKHPLRQKDVAIDPRKTPDGRRATQREALTDSEIQAIYFFEDIAAKIADRAALAVEADIENRRPVVTSATFGGMLYDHFGAIKPTSAGVEKNATLWALHNLVRGFYRDLANSEKFRLAISDRTRDVRKLRQLLPANKDALLSVLGGKSQNQDISALVRLGKLVAHATDIPSTADDPQAVFEQRLKLFASSDGQNEIKRNESFTRVWRTSVAFSLRSMQVLAPALKTKENQNQFDEDPASTNYAIIATDKNADFRNLSTQISLIFGDKMVGDHSRTQILLQAAQSDQAAKNLDYRRELLWALLRLTAEIRNATSHFNTKRRLLELLKSEILDWQQNPQPIGGRKANVGHAVARDAFNRLLDFDLKLRRQVILDEFRRLNVHEYVPKTSMDELFAELRQSPDLVGITMPKFMSVLQQAVGSAQADKTKVPQWLKLLAKLDLSNLSKQPDTANRFLIGVLRQLYDSGFAGWLAEKQGDSGFLQQAVGAVSEFKQQRFATYQEQEQKKGRPRAYAVPNLMEETLVIDETTTLDGLISELHARAMSEEALRHTYGANRDRQSDRTNHVNEFKLDIFGYFLGTYLQEQRISWLAAIKDKLPENERAETDELSKHAGDDLTFKVQPWHSQFYVWLYLLPADDLAKLRHQFRKTRALEGKAENPTSDKTLVEIDHLMGLCLAVSSAGFSGLEHGAIVNQTATKSHGGQDELTKLLVSDMNFTDSILPGTNRGLRQLLQMGTHQPLSSIFGRHPVTSFEVAELRKLQEKQETGAKSVKLDSLFVETNKLAKEILDLSKERNSDLVQLEQLCASYQRKAAEAAIYNFTISGARLRDHVRLHQLMMRILGRLLDFTLMWERDRQYVYLGMLYSRIQKGIAEDAIKAGDPPASALPIAVNIKWDSDERKRLGFDLPAELRQRLKEFYPAWTKTRRAISNKDIQQVDVDAGFLPIWHQRFGYVLEGDKAEVELLDAADRALFIDKFNGIEQENPLDKHARALLKADGHPVHEPQINGQRPSYYSGRARIRNDFAHFNMLRGKRHKNFNYLINSVRSLLAYDRKLKNAVPEAISDILKDEGLTIQWTMREDRLKDPRVVPDLVTHLGYIRMKEFSPKFGIPKVSARFTSMVKALFDFGAGGYRREIKVGNEMKAAGELWYPPATWERAEALGLAVPEAIRQIHYPNLASE